VREKSNHSIGKEASSAANSDDEWGHTPWTRWLWVCWSWSNWQIWQSILSFSPFSFLPPMPHFHDDSPCFLQYNEILGKGASKTVYAYKLILLH